MPMDEEDEGKWGTLVKIVLAVAGLLLLSFIIYLVFQKLNGQELFFPW
jgi:hypothetical protein